MTLAGLFLFAALLYAAWTGLGWWKIQASERPDLLGGTLLTLILPAALIGYTLKEYPAWSHLTFPFSLLAWVALLLGALLAGIIQLTRGHPASGWPLLGLPVSAGVLAMCVALFSAAQGRAS